MFIAEIGINHHGDLNKALELVKDASEAGCDSVKLQYRGLDFYNALEEIGDEILEHEISRTRLTHNDLQTVVDFVRRSGMKAGISVFRLIDAEELIGLGFEFDFWKVPSAECENVPLVEYLIGLEVEVYLSSGGANLKSLARTHSSNINSLNVMHCVANYPVLTGFQAFGYINILKAQGWKSVGYSSHDENYEAAFIAIGLGIDSLERHIVADKGDGGLDSSSSSTPDEFKILGKMFNARRSILAAPAVRNQGEVINMQNLGTSLYPKHDILAGELPEISEFNVRAPRKGLSVGEYLKGTQKGTQKLFKNLNLGEPISSIHLEADQVHRRLGVGELQVLRKNRVGLPVRLHDHEKFAKQFGLGFHEFHLSYGEVLSDLLLPYARKVSTTSEYSIHLPDYVSSNAIIDPLSSNSDLSERSAEVISKVVKFAQILSDRSGLPCNIVGSFPYNSEPPDKFVDKLYSCLHKFEDDGIEILPQWLPSVGWYFGGACRIDTFNSEDFVSLVELHNLKHCLDICHLIMSANASNISWKDWFRRLIPSAKHIHLADARGISEEGLPLFSGDLKDQKLKGIDGLPVILEVWQGHLNDGQKFYDDLSVICNKKFFK